MKRGMKLDEYCIENNLEYLLDEWDYEKNDGVPHDYARGCDDHVNWICLECGYPWSAAINRRAGRVENGVIKRKPTGCPVCENLVVWEGHNDLESNRPDIAAEWDYEVNKPVRPSQVTCGRNKPQYGWICSYNPMHKWKQTVNVRVHGNHGKGTGCPKCVGRKISESLKKRALQDGENTLAKKFPEIAKEWNYEKNNGLTPDDVAPFCNDKADWICSVCNRGWSDFIGNRTLHGRGCKYCNREKQTSICEQLIYYYVSMLFPNVNNGYSGGLYGEYTFLYFSIVSIIDVILFLELCIKY